jgi:hypothetical protein
MPIGIFKSVERATYDSGVHAQINAARAKRGTGDIDATTAPFTDARARALAACACLGAIGSGDA